MMIPEFVCWFKSGSSQGPIGFSLHDKVMVDSNLTIFGVFLPPHILYKMDCYHNGRREAV